MLDIYNRPIAFHERESAQPDTSEYGILRREWRLVPFNLSNPIHVECANHLQRAGRFTPSLILEQRYIRRGTIEPWEVFDAYDTETAALEAIDPRAIAIDCPALVWVQHDRKRIKLELEAERIAERDKEAQLAETRRLRGLSIDAWYKLYNNPKYRPLCDEWNDMTTRSSALALKPQLQLDSEFMRLYNLAHRGAITATSKRMAMRACLDYYDFMWRHREPVSIETATSVKEKSSEN